MEQEEKIKSTNAPQSTQEKAITELISVEEAIELTEKYLNGNPHNYQSDKAYIKPQSPVHLPCDSWNSEQTYHLIDRSDLLRSYRYSFLDGRFFYAYTHEEANHIKLTRTPPITDK